MRSLPALAVWLLAACGGEELHREGFEVRGCARDRIRLLAFAGMQCTAENPLSGEVAAAEPIADVMWDDPSGSSSPALRVPLDSIVSVVAHCLDDEGIAREWGCDDDSDGSVSIDLAALCLGDGCEDCQACPGGALPWKGAEGQSCFSSCAVCDEDRDTFIAEACGGDDCDDNDAGIHPGAPDPLAEDGEWTVERPSAFVGDDVSLAIGPLGAVHVGAHATEGPGVAVATRDQRGVWTVEPVDLAPGLRPTLAIGPPGGSRHLAYYLGLEKKLRYATDAQGQWSREDIGPADVDQILSRASIGVGEGVVNVAFHDETQGDLLFSSRSGQPEWVTVPVDTRDDSGGYASLALDGETVHIAYVRARGGDLDLYYTVRPPGRGPFLDEPELVDEEGAAGEFVTIQVAGNAALILAYRERDRGELRAASRGGGEPGPFQVTTLEAEGQRGAFASMALDEAGAAHVSHYGMLAGELRYTMFDAGRVILSEAIPYPGDPLQVQSSSIAVAPDGTVHAIWGGTGADRRPASPVYARRIKGEAIDQDCSGVDGQ